MSHHPETIPQPFTPEPTESYSKQDIDEWVEVMRQLSKEAYENPEIIRTAPHKGAVGRIDETFLVEESTTCLTWRKWHRIRAAEAYTSTDVHD